MPVGRFSSRNLVVREGAESEDIKAIADRNGWVFAGQVERDPGAGVFYEVKWDPGNGGSVHYIVDEFADVVYLVVRNDDQGAAEESADRIADQFPVRRLDDMLEEFDASVYPAGWAKALMRLGVGSPLVENSDVVTRVRESVEHKDARVRRAALWAMVYAEWPVYRALLAQMAGSDEDPHIAREAAQAVARFDATEETGR
ncbi:MAG TPA: HEAT repeat domain-containing protein [Streptomyces sp.]|uniref:HEAT repeat domain-containing protein n=1 Tax=Streptomyces sp. TaxID=1931 RepID=UPI002C192929|nr:HEAT repeat domain-containing protein [Streptomyces sp.]HWU07508.1 HEAT repeat domain-containing protein [Streptomyces sp.]